jgi:hypothetical protein
MDFVSLAILLTATPLVRTLQQHPRPIADCEVGAVRACSVRFPMHKNGGPFMTCVDTDLGPRWNHAECATPIVLSFDGGPVRFTAAPGDFSIGGYARTEWPSAATPWLVHDRDGTGCAEDDRELFAGFSALAALDDNHDARIDDRDRAFAELTLWFDRDQDRRCGAGEVVALERAGVVSIDLRAPPPSTRPFGSHEGERATFAFVRGDARLTGTAIDVYLAPF